MSRKKPEIEKFELYLRYQERNYIISNDFSSGDWSGYNEDQIEWEPVALKRNKPKDSWPSYFETLTLEFDPKDLKKLWIVVVRYTDGGTFGCTHGYWTIKGIFKNDDDAYAFKKSIEEDKYNVDENEYCEWKGYFASLDDVEVHRMEIDD